MFAATPSYQTSTYDDYNYQHQQTATWRGIGEPQVNSSAGNHVTGLESGSGSSWWTYTAGTGSGSSSSTGWSASWNYDETVTYPGFYEGAYYGLDYGGGREEYFAYLGDAFSEYAGYDSGFFAFVYSHEESLFVQA